MSLHRQPATRGLVLAAVGSILAFSPTHSGDAAEPKPGWTAGLDLTLEGAAGLRGGADRGETLHGLALAKVEWNQKQDAGGGLHFRTFVSALSLVGRGPTEHFVRDFLTVSNMEGFASTRLYSWWGEAQHGEWSLRAGALLADDEFAGTEAGGNFFNAAFGWPAFISANTINTGPAFFVAAPGLRLERRFGETAAWRLGVYDGDTFDSAAGDPGVTRHGLHYRLGGDQGWFVMSEVALAPAERATRYKAGLWLHTAAFADLRDDENGKRLADTGAAPRRHANNYGGYAAVERTLAGKAGGAGHVAAFVRAGVSPADRNTVSWALDTGLAYTGLFPGRATDVTALGLAHARFSPRFAAHARATDPLSPALDFEQVIELSHSAALSERFTLQPDLQFVRHPGGSSAQRDALVFLLRLKATY